MKRENNRKFEIAANDLLVIGEEVENLCESIKRHQFGVYSLDNTDGKIEKETRIAVRIIEGMTNWQLEQKKGVRVIGYSKPLLEIFELQEPPKRTDEFICMFPIKGSIQKNMQRRYFKSNRTNSKE